jgi:predicted PurR-regulated permease PerM
MDVAALSARAIARIVLIIVGVLVSLYLLYQLRQPITWLLISVFLAVALSRPVNYLNRYMKRGFAIATVYLGMLAAIVALGLLLIPPIVTQVNDLADNAPNYAQDAREWIVKNKTLRKLEEDYDITQKLEEEAGKLPSKLGGAAGTLSDVGIGIVNRLFALITILVMTAFLLASGPKWVSDLVAAQPPDRGKRMRKVLDDMAAAVSGYVSGALLVSFIDGLLAFIVLTILGVPFAPALAVVMGVMSLIPLVGATIGAVLVGLVTLFNDFPGDTIVWTIWAIAYQQIENSLIQPQVQRRTVQVHPFIVLVSVLFGATLLGILGALLAVPFAASVQILIKDWREFRRSGELPSESSSPGGPRGPDDPLRGAQPAG